MDLREKIIVAIEPALMSKGYDVVQVRIGKTSRLIIGIDIENQNDTPVSVNNCVEANKIISVILDVENFITSSYNLEVGSSGEHRPLTKICDYERFCGKDVKIELHALNDGIKKIEGVLLRVERKVDNVIIYLENGKNEEKAVFYADIKKASVKRVFEAKKV